MNHGRILVTGAAGFVGGYVLAALRGRDAQVLGLVRREAQGAKLKALGAEPVLGDVTDQASLTRAMAGVEAVIHLAAVNRNRGAVSMEAVNYRGTVNVLGAARAAGVQRMVQVVGIGADSRRSSPLSRTQGLAAEAILNADVPATVLEAGVIYERGDAFTTMIAGLLRLFPIAVVPGDGTARFEPISAHDVGAAAANALEMPETVGKRYQIVGPEVVPLDRVYDHLLRVLEIRRPKLHVPASLLRPMVRLMDRFLPEPPVTTALLDLLELDVLAQDNAAELLLGRRARVFGEQLAYLREVTAGQFLAIIFGRQNRRDTIRELSG